MIEWIWGYTIFRTHVGCAVAFQTYDEIPGRISIIEMDYEGLIINNLSTVIIHY